MTAALPHVGYDPRAAFDARFAELCAAHGLDVPAIDVVREDRRTLVVLIGTGREHRACFVWKSAATDAADQAFRKWSGR